MQKKVEKKKMGGRKAAGTIEKQIADGWRKPNHSRQARPVACYCESSALRTGAQAGWKKQRRKTTVDIISIKQTRKGKRAEKAAGWFLGFCSFVVSLWGGCQGGPEHWNHAPQPCLSPFTKESKTLSFPPQAVLTSPPAQDSGCGPASELCFDGVIGAGLSHCPLYPRQPPSPLACSSSTRGQGVDRKLPFWLALHPLSCRSRRPRSLPSPKGGTAPNPFDKHCWILLGNHRTRTNFIWVT